MREHYPSADDAAGMLCSTLAEAVKELTDDLGEEVTCGVMQADDIPEPTPFPAGALQVRNRISNRSSDNKALDLSARITLRERWNWLAEGNPDRFAPPTTAHISTKEDLQGHAVDIEHCDSADSLGKEVRKAVRKTRPAECGNPVVLGVAAFRSV